MKKLTLRLDTLAVDSFATDEVATAAGTVEGRALRTEFPCDQTATYCKTILTYCPCTPRADVV